MGLRCTPWCDVVRDAGDRIDLHCNKSTPMPSSDMAGALEGWAVRYSSFFLGCHLIVSSSYVPAGRKSIVRWIHRNRTPYLFNATHYRKPPNLLLCTHRPTAPPLPMPARHGKSR